MLDKATVIGVERMMGATYAGQVFESMPVEPNELADGTQSSITIDESGPEFGTSGQVDPATSQLLATALDMAFPGAGTLFSLAQTFASMDANRELMDHLTAEGAQLMARKNELVDRQSERYVGALLAELDQRRAQALADSADAQIGTFQYAMRKAVEEKNIQMLKIGIRRGWAFYLAERMREEFDQFDRSYALWARGKSEKGVIEQEIRNDPQNVRYALDSQIQLFDWLDRSRESAKTDPDFLRVHWNRMLRLAKDVCGKQGCKPGDGLLGQVGNTREVHVVSELLSSHDRQRFLDWQRKPLGAFRVAFQISPMNGLVPPTAYNIRLVDLRLAGLDHKGSLFTTEQVSLSHTGVSYIGIPAQTSDETLEYRLESLLPRESSSFNSPTEFDLDALRRRYDSYFTGSNLPSARNFEGYGLFATYEMVIEPTQANLNLKDIVLRLAYFYQHLGSVPNEAAYMRQQLAKQGKKLQKLSSRFPELSPYDFVLASNNKRCSLPVPESADRQLFGSDIQLRANSYEATSFFAGRRERKWPEAINHSKIKDLKDRITLLGECSKGELKPMLKSIATVKERALSLGRALDQDQAVAAQYISALGLPSNARLAQEFPKLAEQEFLTAKDAQ